MDECECSDCVFFVPMRSDPENGFCHRNAPVPSAELDRMLLKLLADIHWKIFDEKDTELSSGMEFESLQPEQQSWPCVDAKDFCGEFKRK